MKKWLTDKYASLLPPKTRKNAVHALDFMIACTPGSLGDKPSDYIPYLEEAFEWVGKVFGKENVIAGHLHLDERNPHLHVQVMPIVNGKLNCSFYLDGKKKCKDFVTRFAREVGSKFGLRRGVESKVAKHEDIQHFYGRMDEELHTQEEKTRRIELAEQKAVETLDSVTKLTDATTRLRQIYEKQITSVAPKEIAQQVKRDTIKIFNDQQNRLRDSSRKLRESIRRDDDKQQTYGGRSM